MTDGLSLGHSNLLLHLPRGSVAVDEDSEVGAITLHKEATGLRLRITVELGRLHGQRVDALAHSKLDVADQPGGLIHLAHEEKLSIDPRRASE
jgi:hypothetical protein